MLIYGEKTLRQETAPSHLPQSEVSTPSDPSKLWYTIIKKFSFLHTFSPDYVKYKLLLLPQSFFTIFQPNHYFSWMFVTLIAIVSSLFSDTNPHSASTLSTRSTLKETL